MKLLLLVMLVFATDAALASPRFRSTPDGEVVSDLELDLSMLPAFTWVTDPFLKAPGRMRAPASASTEDTDYTLQATTLQGDDSIAVVNDRVVRVGDRVGNRTVLRIGQDYIVLGYKGSVIESFLDEKKLKTERGTKRAPATVVPDPGVVKIEEVKQ